MSQPSYPPPGVTRLQPYQPYRPAPRRPGVGVLIGAVIAIVSINAGAAMAIIILTGGFQHVNLLVINILRPAILVGITVPCVLYVRKWRRRGGADRSSLVMLFVAIACFATVILAHVFSS